MTRHVYCSNCCRFVPIRPGWTLNLVKYSPYAAVSHVCHSKTHPSVITTSHAAKPDDDPAAEWDL